MMIEISEDGQRLYLRRASYIWKDGDRDPQAESALGLNDGDIICSVSCEDAYKDHAHAKIIVDEINRRLKAYSREEAASE